MKRIFQMPMVFVATFLVFICLFPAPADAHPGGGNTVTNYQSRLLSPDPPAPGLGVEVLEFGDRIELTNRTGSDVVVSGYANEPYLLFRDNAVFENERSPATYVNRDRFGSTVVSPQADPAAEPVWKQVTTGHTFGWHDHRAHWMSPSDPPQVRDDPGRTHVLNDRWVIPVQVNSQQVELVGDLRWVPPASPWPYVAGAVAIFVLLLFAGRRYPHTVPVALFIAIVANAFHVAGTALAQPGGIGEQVSSMGVGTAALVVTWIVGAIAANAFRRRSDFAMFGCLFASLMLFVAAGLSDMAIWWNSQMMFAFDPVTARAAVAVTIGASLGAAVLTISGLRSRTSTEVSGASEHESHSEEWSG